MLRPGVASVTVPGVVPAPQPPVAVPVKIPPVLRPSVGGEKEVEASGGNVGEVLRALADAHPQTQGQLFADGGDLNRYVNVYLNDEDVG